MSRQSTAATLTVSRPTDGILRIGLVGRWRIGAPVPALKDALDVTAEAGRARKVEFDSSALDAWDSSLLAFLRRLQDACRDAAIDVDIDGLPKGARRMLQLAAAVPEKTDAGKAAARLPFFARIGESAQRMLQTGVELLDFIGELALAAARAFRGQARLRGKEVLGILQECGADALPIVSLVSILMGLIMAFVGSIQLALFGAQIYVADLVGIVVAREMGAVMTAIIMAGRTGAAFAAKIGTMQTNEEIDALRTLGIAPMEYLVLPRVAALVLMMPLLTIYADLVGIIGGLMVGVGMLDISLTQYLDQTRNALHLTHFAIGIVKSLFFGLLVAVAGCMQGMKCGRSASDVGLAATSAVVIAIVGIIVVDGLFALITNVLNI